MSDFLKNNFPSLRKKITQTPMGEKQMAEEVARIDNEFRKKITGAAMSEKELEFILKSLPKSK